MKDNTRALNILILEDVDEDAELTERVLRKDGMPFVSFRATSAQEYLDALDTFKPDVILADHSLPGYDSHSAHDALKGSGMDIPFILVTGTVSEEFAVESLHKGVDDYLVKPRLARLPAAIRHALEKRRAEHARRKAEKALLERETLLRTIFDTEPQCVKLLDLNGTVMQMNKAGLEMLEVEAPGQVIGRCVYPIITDEHREAFRLLTERTTQGESGEMEFEVHTFKNNRRWFSTRSVPLRDSSGRIFAALAITRDITEKKESDRALLESERRYRTLYEAAPVGITSVDDKGRFIHCNKALEHMLGYSESELREMRFNDITVEEDRDLGAEFFREMLNGSVSSFRIEKRYRTKSGETVWADVTVSPIRNAQGKLLHTVTIVEDITSRKLATQALRESEERFRAFMDNLPALVFIHDEEGRFVFVNKTWEETFGRRAGEVIGKTPLDVWPRDVAGTLHDEDMRVLASGKPAKLLEKIPLPDGTLREWSVVKFPLILEPGRRLVGGTALDVTEQRRAEEQVRDQAALLDISRDAVLVRSLEGLVLFWNKGAEQMYGWAKEEALGKHIESLIYKGGTPEFHQVEDVFFREGSWTGELTQYTREGKEILVESRWTLVYGNDGKPKSIFAVNTDITQKKQLEEHIRQAQKMESIGTLAGGIAHDFNNILSIIIGYAGMLSEPGMPPDKMERAVNAINQASERGAGLVKQLLTFSRKSAVSIHLVDVNDAVTELSRMLAETFPRKITLALALGEHLPKILVDKTQLNQALLNLCVNARDAMPHGGSITISSSLVEGNALREHLAGADKERYLHLSVSDTGSGMDKETLSRIFEPFFTTKSPDRGTGLGLAVVYGIMKSHKGLIDVESEPGRGTAFHLYFPIEKRPA